MCAGGDNFTVSDTRGRIIEENHYYAFGLKIAGISSVKFGDAHEGSLKNNNLYNDKELWDDADLAWYDYGFRNYDAQIGRFTQLDPLTDKFPQLTPYQYASNDPIDNIDIDGLEGELSTLAKPKFLKAIVINLPKAAPVATKTISALNIGINAFKIGANVADHTVVRTLVNNMNVSRMKTDSYLTSIFSKMRNWLDIVSHGRGSYQDYGIVFSGNSNGTTMEFRDHAGKIIDYLDIGPLFGAFKAAGLNPKVFEELLSSSGGIKYLGNLIEAGNTSMEASQSVIEAIKASKEKHHGLNPMFLIKGNVIYHRSAGYKTKNTDGKGGGQLTNQRATDTFPRKKLIPYYPYPLD